MLPPFARLTSLPRGGVQVTELLRDAWLLVQMLLLTATLYQALESWIEVSEALLGRDVAGARAAAAKRFIQLSKEDPSSEDPTLGGECLQGVARDA